MTIRFRRLMLGLPLGSCLMAAFFATAAGAPASAATCGQAKAEVERSISNTVLDSCKSRGVALDAKKVHDVTLSLGVPDLTESCTKSCPTNDASCVRRYVDDHLRPQVRDITSNIAALCESKALR